MKNNQTKFKETEIGPIPEEWDVLELENVIKNIIDYRGKTPKKTDSGIPLVTAKVVKNGKINFTNSEYIAEHDYDSWMQRGIPSAGDVVVTTEAPLGEVAQLPNFKIALAQRIITLSGKDNILDNAFLKYYLLSSLGLGQLKSKETGSVVTGIKQSELRKIKVPIPPLREQKRIAEILGALDEKIELNRRMNDALEKIASAIFKHWFVDFNFPNEQGKPYKSTGGKMIDSELGLIPAGWKVGKLKDEFEIVMGQSPAGNSYNENGDGLQFYQGRTDFGFRFPKRRIYCNAPTRTAEPLSTLVSVRAPVGDINMASEKCCIGRGVGAISKANYPSYTFYKLKSLQTEIKQFDSEGTVFGSINKNSLADITSIISNKKIIDIFEKNVSIIDNEIFNLSQEIDNLSQIRDSLLPRLMSGKIRV